MVLNHPPHFIIYKTAILGFFSDIPLNFPVTFQVVTQFKSSLVGLTEILMSKEPWYVRCIKPNEAKQPGEGSCPQTTHL